VHKFPSVKGCGPSPYFTDVESILPPTIVADRLLSKPLAISGLKADTVNRQIKSIRGVLLVLNIQLWQIAWSMSMVR